VLPMMHWVDYFASFLAYLITFHHLVLLSSPYIFRPHLRASEELSYLAKLCHSFIYSLITN
jgi:hypothetical protein